MTESTYTVPGSPDDLDPTEYFSPEEIEAITADAQLIAADNGVPVDRAVAEGIWQALVAEQLDRLRSKHGAAMIGAEFLSHPGRKIWIGFTTAPPDLDLASYPPGTTIVIATGFPWTERQLEEATITVIRNAAEIFGEIGLTSWGDYRTGTIEVGVGLRPADPRTRRITELPDVGFPVQVTFDERFNEGGPESGTSEPSRERGCPPTLPAS